METEEFLKLYKNYSSLNYLYLTLNQTETSLSQRKSLWFRLYNSNKTRKLIITN